jgi:hypothetical protein
MPKFRKKPVVIEAVKALDLLRAKTHDDFSGIPEWAIEANREGVLEIYALNVEVVTLEGTMEGGVDDWIIRGVKGEIYPCKPDIFAATYDPA